MRVFVTGASGFVGSAIVKDLLGAGHQVLGLVRSDTGAKAVTDAGAEPHRGALDDHDSLVRAATACDGVIHTAFIHDFTNLAASGETDRSAIEAIGNALAGSNRPFVVTSATGHLREGRVGTEADAPDPGTAGKHRTASEYATLALASRGVRVSLVRLPSSVHGDGDHAFVPELVRIARAKGVSAYIGEGQTCWAAVHRLDAAVAYRLALEKAAAGSTFHAVADEGIPTRDIAAAIARGLGVPLESRSPADAAAHFGWLGRFFATDNRVSSARTRESLGWTPKKPGLIADLEHGSYFG